MLLREGERIDDLQRNGRRIIQNPKKFCFGMDAVLLSGFAKIHEGERVLDIGTGNGILPILLEAKTAGEFFLGLEISEYAADMARRSVELNGRQEKISILTGDAREASKRLGRSVFDVVVSNPPYMIAGHGLKNPQSDKAIARHEICLTFSELIRETKALLKPGGRCYFVHRPFRLVEILSTMSAQGIEPKEMRLVHPMVDKEPNMVLIEGIYGGKPRLSILPPLILFETPGTYTKEVCDIYGF